MRAAVGPNSMGDKIQATLQDLESVLAENADLRAQLDARRDGGSLLSAIVGHLRAEGWSVLEPGTSGEDVAAVPADELEDDPPEEVPDFPAGVCLRLVDGALWDGRYVVTTGEKSTHGELPCAKLYAREVVLPNAQDYAGRLYVVNVSEHEWLPDPRTTFDVGQTVRITDGRWAGRMANIAGAKLDDRFPARLLGKAVDVTSAVDCLSSLLLIDPKDPDEQKADSPPLNGSAAPKRTDTAKPADQWHPADDEMAKMATELAMPVEQLRAHLATFKAEMVAKSILQARWGLPFKGWVKKRTIQTTIPGA